MQAITPNEFEGSDSERINKAVTEAARTGRRVRIPRTNKRADGTATRWLLDGAILLPGGTTLELQDCHLKLSDSCRDNFFRSANCGMETEEVQPIREIHILGSGDVLLEGADHPRATGDSGKTLGTQTYGTDAGKSGEHPKGDWRNIGILMAHVENFTLENLRIKDAHCWAISLERCAYGTLRNIDFASCEDYIVDGEAVKFLNQDGLDLRQGCHNITIDGITGYSGDDLVAFTGIVFNDHPNGSLDSSMITTANNRGDGRDDIRHITLRNVRGHCRGGHHIVRLLNGCGIAMHDILIDGIQDTSEGELRDRAALKIGDNHPGWGGVTPLGDTRRISVTHIISRARQAVLIAGSLTDSAISHVIQEGDGEAICLESGPEHIRNVILP